MTKYKAARIYLETYNKVLKIAKKNGRSFIMQLKIIVDKFKS